jgi:subtilisin family serine protease
MATARAAVVAADLARLPGVEYAEPQWLHSIDVIPNDPSYPSQQAYLTRMRLPQAWDVTRGEQGPVVVAIVDGGTSWQHVDLQGNVWTNPGEVPGNSIDDDGNGFVDDVHGWNFANGTGDPTGLAGMPINSMHGTHRRHRLRDRRQRRRNRRHELERHVHADQHQRRPIRRSPGASRIVYAVDNGAGIVNCSWGLWAAPSFELEVITYAWEHGTAVVAAGNNTSTQPHYPSAYPTSSRSPTSTAPTCSTTTRTAARRSTCAPGLNITAPYRATPTRR